MTTHPPGGELPGLAQFGVRDLLRLEAAINAEFRARELVRTNNKPLGDIAECIVRQARGGVLEPNSTKSHDVTTDDGRRIQVKAMGRRALGRSAVFSPFRSFDFDTAVFLVFAQDTFEIAEAWEATAAQIEAVARFSRHVNGHLPSLARIAAVGRDVTVEMSAAYAALDRRTRLPG
ncbi:hypothetical protein [Gordonia sp. (in: high G+C Gram-positive bacteria)]|uniref:DUF6998 domain-containing protein n=1 Tax=Gordonia sp. (in: high G+C Gram-positive bacteria) TaxID=84139 RepID=UPI00352708D3